MILTVRTGNGCPNGLDHNGGVCTCRPARPTGDTNKRKEEPKKDK